MDNYIDKPVISYTDSSGSVELPDNISVDTSNKIYDELSNVKDVNISINVLDSNDIVRENECLLVEKKKKKKKKPRCAEINCKKKLGLVDWNCKCKLKFCSIHRFPDKHQCSFDWYNDKRNKLDKILMSAKSDFKQVDIL